MARIYGKLNTAKMQAVLYFSRKKRKAKLPKLGDFNLLDFNLTDFK